MPSDRIDQTDRVERLQQRCAAARVLGGLLRHATKHREGVEGFRELDAPLEELGCADHDRSLGIHRFPSNEQFSLAEGPRRAVRTAARDA